jgi:hypothetical protein
MKYFPLLKILVILGLKLIANNYQQPTHYITDHPKSYLIYDRIKDVIVRILYC